MSTLAEVEATESWERNLQEEAVRAEESTPILVDVVVAFLVYAAIVTLIIVS